MAILSSTNRHVKAVSKFGQICLNLGHIYPFLEPSLISVLTNCKYLTTSTQPSVDVTKVCEIWTYIKLVETILDTNLMF